MEKPSTGRRYWLVAERFENWQRDAESGYGVLGFGERSHRLVGEFHRDDVLIIYVASGRASIAGSRRVASDRPFRGKDLLWDDIFPLRIATEPIVSLPEEQWVKIHELIPKLSFTQGHADWRQCFRTAIRLLSTEDARVFERAITRASQRRAS